MPKKKLKRFAEMATFPNVVQMDTSLRGRWNRDFFRNEGPITLELACGKGEYALTLAKRYPERNFIGVDLKGARLWSGAKQALRDGIGNVGFVRYPIEQIDEIFAENEVAEIWITFPDPYPRQGKAKKRLTAPRFIELYRQILLPGGIVHFKTDAIDLFNFTEETLNELGIPILALYRDIYQKRVENDLLYIQTTYEKRHLEDGRSINYLCFKP